MSWHARWGKPDPFKKPVKVGERIGPWEVLGEVRAHAHYGVQIKARCIVCGVTRIHVQTRLRYAAKKAKRGGVALGHKGCGKTKR